MSQNKRPVAEMLEELRRKNGIMLSHKLMYAIADFHGKDDAIALMSYEAFNNEGWRLQRALEDLEFLYRVEFISETAKIMFLLKYGDGT